MAPRAGSKHQRNIAKVAELAHGDRTRVAGRGRMGQSEAPARRALDPLYGALADLIFELVQHGPGEGSRARMEQVIVKAELAAQDPRITG